MWAVTAAIMIAISFVYIPMMIMIYSQRNTQAVSFKSPVLILVGGTALYLDAIFNTLLLKYVEPETTTENNYQANYFSCYLSLFDTLVIHYIGYLCLIFRALRIFKIINIEARFLDDIYDFSFFPSGKDG